MEPIYCHDGSISCTQQVVTEDGNKVWIWKLVEWNKAVYDEKTGDEISINFQADTAEELINKCDDD